MSTSKVKICSNALLSIGQKPLNSLAASADQASSDRELVALNLYPMVRDSVLRSHPWNCATRRVVLSPDAEAPAFGYDYRFPLPGDWLRTLDVGNGDVPVDYTIEGRFLLADVDAVQLRYIWRNDDPTSWDVLLVDAMQAAMSARMAVALTGDQGKKQEFERALLQTLRQARAVDGQEVPPETVGDFPLLTARLG